MNAFTTTFTVGKNAHTTHLESPTDRPTQSLFNTTLRYKVSGGSSAENIAL